MAAAHPADPAFPLLAGAIAAERERGDVDFWLQRAMKLAPASSLPHVWAARSLARWGARARALGELKIAAQLDPAQTIEGLCAWVRGGPTAQTVLRVATSHREARVAVLDAGAGCLLPYPAEAEQVDQRILAARPAHLPARLRAAHSDLAARRHDNVIALTRSILATSPNLSEAQVRDAYGLIGLGQPKQAAERLLRAFPRTSEPRPILSVLALARRPDYLASAAQLAGQLGQTDYALAAWEQLCGAEPASRVYCEARDAMRAARQQPRQGGHARRADPHPRYPAKP